MAANKPGSTADGMVVTLTDELVTGYVASEMPSKTTASHMATIDKAAQNSGTSSGGNTLGERAYRWRAHAAPWS
jgi:hypothetical protein